MKSYFVPFMQGAGQDTQALLKKIRTLVSWYFLNILLNAVEFNNFFQGPDNSAKNGAHIYP